MDFFLDTEFVDTGDQILLISLGLVREDGEYGYWINGDDGIIDQAVHHDWLRENVVKHLPVKVGYNKFYQPPVAVSWSWDMAHPEIGAVKPRKMIAQQVQAAIGMAPGNPTLWAWYSAYDHVALAQLFGRMIDLPSYIPMLTCDLKQEAMRLGDPQVPEHTGRVHHALDDARHDREIRRFLLEFEGKA